MQKQVSFALITLILITTAVVSYISLENGSDFLSKKENTSNHHFKSQGSSQFKKIAYINQLSQWDGPKILDAMGLNSPCYNLFILTFWMPGQVSDALSAWENISKYIGTTKYGKTNAEIQKKILELFHAQGKQLFISAFGGTDFPTKSDPVQIASQLAAFVNRNPYIDGVDIDYEDDDAIFNGTGVTWLIKFQKALAEKINNKNIIFTHAPQAPYFSRAYYHNGAYYAIEQEVGHLISWYNVQFYNQESESYDSFQKLFLNSGTPFVKTSYKEILENAKIPISKLVLGKPATRKNADNTGYVEPAELGKICTEAQQKLGYNIPGFFIWEFISDQHCLFSNAFSKNYNPDAKKKVN
ncbi:hypothetical protein ABPG72_018053 [Tetrahymena utriculariae]